MSSLRYRRILVKISGEAMQDENSAISPSVLNFLVSEIKAARELEVDVAVVVGGGNIVRGAMISEEIGINRVTGDYMGMLATVINGMALRSALHDAGVPARLQTALRLEQVAAPYILEKAIRHLDKKRVVIFAGGTGNPYFTTDTAAALRAAEIGADALLKATNVDGVYSADPAKRKDAKRYQSLTMDEAIQQKLHIMDATAFTLCRERHLPIHVFKLQRAGALLRILKNEDEGTLLTA
ncbi:MAG: UMP kinase [Proteobacteria bacterium]|nr:UMP kinase [Pseudomonadota bacterium]MCH9758844.1 UMP kinase [Pseudomonadota bacterium]